MTRDVDSIRIRKWAATGDRTLPSLSTPRVDRAEGYGPDYSQQDGDTPVREVFNQILAEITGMLVEINARGCFLPWSAQVDYLHPALVTGDNGIPYISIAGSGPTSGGAVNPSGNTGGTRWAQVPMPTPEPLPYQPPTATLVARGDVELATVAEAIAGTDRTRAVTPLGLARAIADLRSELVTRFNTTPDFGGAPAIDNTYTRNLQISPLQLPAAGGNSPVSYSLSPGLPSGLSFSSSNRTISGRPTSNSSRRQYTLTARDADNETDTYRFHLAVVSGQAPSFGSGSVSDQVYTVGETITALQIPNASGGVGSRTFSISNNLPAGLSWNASTRRITGTPQNVTPQRTITITVRDINGNTDTLTFRIRVNAAPDPLTFGSASIAEQEFYTGTARSVTLPAASGGVGAVTYALSGVSLPSGLSFNAGSRVLSSTTGLAATLSRTAATYTATDSAGNSVTLMFGIQVRQTIPPVSFGTGSIADQSWTAGTSVNLLLPAASGGNAPLSYAVIGLSSFGGLSFSSTSRRITGTPSGVVAERSLTYRVTEANGGTADISFRASAAAAPTAAPSFGSDTIAAQEFVVGREVNLSLPAASGGQLPLAYSVTNLPAGLSFDATNRRISGTPTSTTGSANSVYSVQDAQGRTDTITFSRSVIRPAPTVTYTFPGSVAETTEQISFALSHTEGVSSYRWQFRSGGSDTWGTLGDHNGYSSSDNDDNPLTMDYSSDGGTTYQLRITWLRNGVREAGGAVTVQNNIVMGSQTFTSDGPFIVPTGVTEVVARLDGGGGGGGGGGAGGDRSMRQDGTIVEIRSGQDGIDGGQTRIRLEGTSGPWHTTAQGGGGGEKGRGRPPNSRPGIAQIARNGSDGTDNGNGSAGGAGGRGGNSDDGGLGGGDGGDGGRGQRVTVTIAVTPGDRWLVRLGDGGDGGRGGRASFAGNENGGDGGRGSRGVVRFSWG